MAAREWAEDAGRMVELGLSWVRIGEFAWAKIERGRANFIGNGWTSDRRSGQGRPQGHPRHADGGPRPKWLVDRYPDILPVDATGTVRKFGARRHYCFSSRRYRSEAARITEAMARRYGEHIYVHAWQTDNE